jgi:catechol 2,3-dioxygenase-like lactoylglutathione lyase family enzyme
MNDKAVFRHRSIHHAAFATADLDNTIHFWRDLLGFRLLLGMGRAGEKQYFFGLSDHAMIAFFEWDGVAPIPRKHHGEPVQGPFVFDHLAIEVETQQGLNLLQDQLIEAGVPVSDVIDHGFAYSIYTYDPNGIALEFLTPKPGVSLFHSPVMADESPSAAALEGVEPISGRWPAVDVREGDERTILPGEGHDLFDE